MTRFVWIAIGIYLALIFATLAGLFQVRQKVLATLDTPGEMQAWERWRETARQQDGTAGPVQRRIPTSSQPPALTLLRDHFGTSVVGALLLTSAVYWASMFFVRGVLFGRKFEIDHEQNAS